MIKNTIIKYSSSDSSMTTFKISEASQSLNSSFLLKINAKKIILLFLLVKMNSTIVIAPEGVVSHVMP